MISSVTTSTDTLIAAASTAVLAVVALIVLLIAKELLSATSRPRERTAQRILNVAILPLLVVFAIMVLVRLAEILRQQRGA